jgi:hypothetical protein
MSKRNIESNIYAGVLFCFIITVLLATKGEFQGSLVFYVIGFLSLLMVFSE